MLGSPSPDTRHTQSLRTCSDKYMRLGHAVLTGVITGAHQPFSFSVAVFKNHTIIVSERRFSDIRTLAFGLWHFSSADFLPKV